MAEALLVVEAVMERWIAAGQGPQGCLDMSRVNLWTLVFQQALFFEAPGFEGVSTSAR